MKNLIRIFPTILMLATIAFAQSHKSHKGPTLRDEGGSKWILWAEDDKDGREFLVVLSRTDLEHPGGFYITAKQWKKLVADIRKAEAIQDLNKLKDKEFKTVSRTEIEKNTERASHLSVCVRGIKGVATDLEIHIFSKGHFFDFKITKFDRERFDKFLSSSSTWFASVEK